MATTLFSIILFIHFHRNGLVLGLTEFFFFFLNLQNNPNISIYFNFLFSFFSEWNIYTEKI